MTVRKRSPRPFFEIDGKKFVSATLVSAYKEFTEAQKKGLIRSFSLPEGPVPKTKFHSMKCEVDDMTFDSIMEARYYVYLRQLQAENIVDTFECQRTFELQPKFKKDGKTIRPISYIADFLVQYHNGTEKAIDVKGRITKEFALKHKMFDYKFPKTELELVQYRVKIQQWIKIV